MRPLEVFGSRCEDGMKSRERALFLVVAIPGLIASLLSVATFLSKVEENGLAWHPDQSPQEHYLAVGAAYSQGFGAGFFLCFFLILIAIVAGSWKRRPEGRSARGRLLDRLLLPSPER